MDSLGPYLELQATNIWRCKRPVTDTLKIPQTCWCFGGLLFSLLTGQNWCLCRLKMAGSIKLRHDYLKMMFPNATAYCVPFLCDSAAVTNLMTSNTPALLMPPGPEGISLPRQAGCNRFGDKAESKDLKAKPSSVSCPNTTVHTVPYWHIGMHTYLPTHLPTYLHTYLPTYLHTYIILHNPTESYIILHNPT